MSNLTSYGLNPMSNLTSKERLTQLETSDKYIMEKIDNIEKLVIEIRAELRQALDRKADKWVERTLVWLGTFIGVGLLSWLGALIIKATIFFQ